MNKGIISASVIAIGIAVLGLYIKSGLNGFVTKDRVVTVKGLAEKEVKADKVIWPIAYTEMGDDLSVLYKTVERKNKLVTDMLFEKRINADEITNNIDITDLKTYSSDSPFRYKLTSVITVNTNNVNAVLLLMKNLNALIEKGLAISFNDYNYAIKFEYTGLNSIKPEMIKEATKNARKAALQFAQDSESKLGKIKRANQGQFSIEDRDQTTKHIKKVRVVTTVEYALED